MSEVTISSNIPKHSESRPAILLYLAYLLSGTAGLIYQVMWTRSFSLVFGSTTQSAAAVLAAFFAGLAVGCFLGARLARRRERAVLGYAVAEVVVILTALAVNVWLALFHQWYPALYQSALGGAETMTMIKLILAFVALGPPSVAMGMTLPLIVRALVDSTAHMGRRVSFAYGLNSLGAALGVFLAGFVLPPVLGMTNTLYVAFGLNLIAAFLAVVHWWFVDTERNSEIAALPTASAVLPTTNIVRPLPLVALVVFVSGFGTLALEVLYTRLIGSIADSSVFSFAMMLSTFLVGLAAASLAISIVADRVKNLWRLLAWTQACGALAILMSPVSFQWAFSLRTLSFSDSLSGYLLQLFLITNATIGPAIFLIGTALPIAWKIGTNHSAEAGQVVGRLTGLNTLAGVVGSVIAGFIMIPVLGITHSLTVVAVMYAALAIVLWRAVTPKKWPLLMIFLATMFAFLYTFGVSQVNLLIVNHGESEIYYHEGESANVAVLQEANGVRLIRINNRYTLGSSQPSAINLQRGQSGLPLMLHPDPQRVVFIGIATGISVSSILDFPVQRVVAIELIPGVVAATEEFKSVNRGVLTDPRVEVLVADGRNHLFATEEVFDVIVGDLFVPWHAGTGYMYTREHFAAVSQRLASRGIFAQWLPGNLLSVEELRTITHTFLDVFPRTQMWINRTLPSSPMIALLGYADKPPGNARQEQVELNKEFLDLEYVASGKDLRRWAGSAQLNTDEFPLIEFAAAANHYEKGERNTASILHVIKELGSSGARND